MIDRVRSGKTLLSVSFAFAASASTAVLASAACPHAGDPIQPVLTTLAGTGKPGVANGDAATAASFIEPSGVAVSADGSIFVADASANQIRRISHGVVTSFAGAAPVGASPEAREGGFADGPVATARFHRPVAVAVRPDGAVFVADSLNHAIRKIQNGVVTTVSRDLDSPRALQFDTDGVLYIADYGSGIRALGTDGTLSPVDTISGADRATCGVSVAREDGVRLLAFTDSKSLQVIEGTNRRQVAFTDEVDPPGEGRVAGSACAVQILTRDAVVVSDLYDNDVRFVRFSLGGPVAAPAMVETLARGRDDSDWTVGGFRDGPSAVARVDVPRGLGLTRSGDVLLADAGNRRIRTIRGIDARGPQSLDTSGSLSIAQPPSNAYRVIVIGNSYAFTNALWPNSIPGAIERRLAADRSVLGLGSCPNVSAYRLSGAGVGDLADFVSTYYGDGQADLVVFLIDGGNVTKDTLKALAALPNATDKPDPYSAANTSLGLSSVTKRLASLKTELAAGHTSLAFAFIPDGRSLSPLENIRGDSLPTDLPDLYSDYRPAFLTYKMARQYQDAIASVGAHTIRLIDPLVAAEEGAVRVPLYGANDPHPSTFGNTVIGNAIANDLEAWKPWLKDANR